MADKWIERWEVPSHSNPSRVYTVAIDAEGNWGCSCPAWTRNRHKWGDCKHIKEVRAEVMDAVSNGYVLKPALAEVLGKHDPDFTVPTPTPKPMPTPDPQPVQTRAAFLEI